MPTGTIATGTKCDSSRNNRNQEALNHTLTTVCSWKKAEDVCCVSDYAWEVWEATVFYRPTCQVKPFPGNSRLHARLGRARPEPRPRTVFRWCEISLHTQTLKTETEFAVRWPYVTYISSRGKEWVKKEGKQARTFLSAVLLDSLQRQRFPWLPGTFAQFSLSFTDIKKLHSVYLNTVISNKKRQRFNFLLKMLALLRSWTAESEISLVRLENVSSKVILVGLNTV